MGFAALNPSYGLVKIYGPSIEGPRRYSPPVCLGARKGRARQARSHAHQHILCRAQQPQYQNALAALHSTDKRFQQEARVPRARDVAALRVLQFRSHP